MLETRDMVDIGWFFYFNIWLLYHCVFMVGWLMWWKSCKMLFTPVELCERERVWITVVFGLDVLVYAGHCITLDIYLGYVAAGPEKSLLQSHGVNPVWVMISAGVDKLLLDRAHLCYHSEKYIISLWSGEILRITWQHLASTHDKQCLCSLGVDLPSFSFMLRFISVSFLCLHSFG